MYNTFEINGTFKDMETPKSLKIIISTVLIFLPTIVIVILTALFMTSYYQENDVKICSNLFNNLDID